MAAVIGLLAGCSLFGGAVSLYSDAGSPAPSPSSVSVREEPAPGSGGASPVASSSVDPVAALLPSEIEGQLVQKGSLPGDRFLASGFPDQGLAAYLQLLGLQPREVVVSYAYLSADPTSTGVLAFRVDGIDPQAMQLALSGGREPEVRGGSGWQTAQVGGKPTVTAAGEGGAAGSARYRYAAGNLVFFVTAGHESTAAAILAGLP